MIRIVADSSFDRTPDRIEKGVSWVPFKINIDEKVYKDDENLDIEMFAKELSNSKDFESACPSPDEYFKAFHKSDGDVFCFTITSKLSGSYNAAVLAKKMINEVEPDKKVHIFDSKGTSTTIGLIYDFVQKMIDDGHTFEEIVIETEQYIRNIETMFILDSLSNLHKKGRLSNLSMMLVTTLKIYPIMGADNGLIEKLAQIRGKQKALKKFVDIMAEKCSDFSNKVIHISHADNEEEVNVLKKYMSDILNPKDIVVYPVRGLNYVYADRGGIIVSF